MASLMKKWMKFWGSTVKERQMSSEQKQFWTNVLAPKNETTTMSHFSAASIQTDVVKIKSLTDTHKHTHSLSLSLSLTHTLLSPSLSLIGDTTHSLILSLLHIDLLPQSHYCLFSLSFFLFLFFSPYMPSSFFSQFPHTQAHTLTLARTSTQTRTHTHTHVHAHTPHPLTHWDVFSFFIIFEARIFLRVLLRFRDSGLESVALRNFIKTLNFNSLRCI